VPLWTRSGKADAPNAVSIYLFATIQHFWIPCLTEVKQSSGCREVDPDLTWNASTAAHEELPPTSSAAKGCTRIEGDQEVMRRKRIDLKARGIVCAVKRANVIGARDQRTTSGPAGRQDPHRQAEDMTAPTIKRNAAK
jgi:hypothetical protein